MTQTQHSCASCGAEAEWLICADYGLGISGRLLPYCSTCREDKRDGVIAFVPIRLVELNPEAVLLGLYSAGVTLSDPATFAEMFWPTLPEGWIRAAKRHVKAWEEATTDLYGATRN